VTVKRLRRILRFAGYGIAGFVTLVLIYVAIALIFLLFPANSEVQIQSSPRVRVYVLNNGVHTDVVLPVRADAFDWQSIFPKTQFLQASPTADLIAFGWGDAEFYLQTPSWSELKFNTALRALTGSNQALLHVEYLASSQLPDQRFPLDLTTPQYRQLRLYIMQSLQRPGVGAQLRFAEGYGESDAFFPASGAYSPIYTCNSWTGDALRQAGVKVSRWTPFPMLVTWHLAESRDGRRTRNESKIE
jgi:uncharacterized protein (TIGR02117 family)